MERDNFKYLLGIGFFLFSIFAGVFYLGVRPVNQAPPPPSFSFSSPKPKYPLVTYLPLNFFPASISGLSAAPEISAESGLLYDLTNKKTLFAKEPEKKLLIASLTKLMTALVASENVTDKKQRFFVFEEDLKLENPYPDLRDGDNFSLEEAFYFILIRSDNVLAQALAKAVFPEGSKFFVFEMNKKAQELKMNNTLFYDPVGLSNNLSTTMDLKNLTEAILKSNQEVFLISKISEIKILSPDNKVFNLKNTNTLVSRIPGIFGSKTGFTPEASGSLLVVFKDDKKMVLSVVLGSQDRFGDTMGLINWYWKNRN
ncbi:MAG: peptidase S11 [Parcubacteria group bacterium GW2011_GWC1_45_9]|nr:MAG: peptidase S11 [Parcubacteria group bacterium GW2011_GWA1_Parcubacteria_45_10]KKT88602.1 MAG: peptidase S11 [Parcubacteria group bacterium GW2011_GWB1_45_10]KKU17042.1 MAG: peptidase S11 [Parcubacteria group bacterium GW2011_GWC1_45_9]HCI05227.1 hypothetical protein [Patescibacteria group bacterium]